MVLRFHVCKPIRSAHCAANTQSQLCLELKLLSVPVNYSLNSRGIMLTLSGVCV